MADSSTPRPRALTFVAWYLLIMGGMSLASLFSAASPTVRAAWAELGADPALLALSGLVSGVGYVAAGVGVLRGAVWGRTLFLAVGALGLVAAAFVHQTEAGGLLLAATVYGLVASILSRPPARAYFAGTYEPPPEQAAEYRALRGVQAAERNGSDVKRVFGVLAASAAALLLTAALTGVAMIGGSAGLGAAGMIALLALPVLWLATALWGAARWAGLVGWTLFGGGVYAGVSGLAGAVASQADEWEATLAQLGPAADMLHPGGFSRLAMLGLILALIGAALIVRQRERDRYSAEARAE